MGFESLTLDEKSTTQITTSEITKKDIDVLFVEPTNEKLPADAHLTSRLNLEFKFANKNHTSNTAAVKEAFDYCNGYIKLLQKQYPTQQYSTQKDSEKASYLLDGSKSKFTLEDCLRAYNQIGAEKKHNQMLLRQELEYNDTFMENLSNIYDNKGSLKTKLKWPLSFLTSGETQQPISQLEKYTTFDMMYKRDKNFSEQYQYEELQKIIKYYGKAQNFSRYYNAIPDSKLKRQEIAARFILIYILRLNVAIYEEAKKGSKKTLAAALRSAAFHFKECQTAMGF